MLDNNCLSLMLIVMLNNNCCMINDNNCLTHNVFTQNLIFREFNICIYAEHLPFT